eukprot:scaffold10500_cov84-Phaeocystis_antarctica.AAC.1
MCGMGGMGGVGLDLLGLNPHRQVAVLRDEAIGVQVQRGSLVRLLERRVALVTRHPRPLLAFERRRWQRKQVRPRVLERVELHEQALALRPAGGVRTDGRAQDRSLLVVV